MRSLWKRLLARWSQFRIETVIFIIGLRSLIVNLAYLGRLRSADPLRIAVLVDSRREAMLLWLLRLFTVVPECTVHVIQRPPELDALAHALPADGTLLVATSRLYLKHYQRLVDLSRRRRLLVL